MLQVQSHCCVNVCSRDIYRARATHGNSGGPGSTLQPRKWGVPAKPKKEPTPVKVLEVTKPKYRKVPQHNHPGDIQPIDPKLGSVHITRVMSLWDNLQRNFQHEILFTQVWPPEPDCKQVDRLMKMQAVPNQD